MSDADRVARRLRDMRWCMTQTGSLLAGKSLADMVSQPATPAAFERFLEILSEASRHIPQILKDEAGAGVPWRRVADLGNHIRHAYHRIDAAALWSIYEDEFPALDAAIDAMLATLPDPGATE